MCIDILVVPNFKGDSRQLKITSLNASYFGGNLSHYLAIIRPSYWHLLRPSAEVKIIRNI